VRALGDRISHWCLFNEPWVFTFLGYVYGTHAPARKNFADCMRATHVVNIAQGQSFRAIKAINSKLQVGTAFSMANCELRPKATPIARPPSAPMPSQRLVYPPGAPRRISQSLPRR